MGFISISSISHPAVVFFNEKLLRPLNTQQIKIVAIAIAVFSACAFLLYYSCTKLLSSSKKQQIIQKASEMIDKKNLPETKKIIEDALKDFPQDPDFLDLHNDFVALQGKLEKKLADSEKEYNSNPQNKDALRDCAQALLMLGRYDEAKTKYAAILNSSEKAEALVNHLKEKLS